MWSANLFQVASGQIGPRLNFESMSWAMALNDTESISMKLRKSDLPNVNLGYWLDPWWAGVVIFWDDQPIVAGPIVSRPNETPDTVSLTCGGIRSVLAKRFVINEQDDWSKLSKSVVSFKGLSLGTIAQRVVQLVQQKPGGSLPISFPMGEQTAADNADHERNYRGFNIANINCDDVLTKLSNVIDGPDIMFKPRLVEDNRLTFDMWHGTEDYPRIAQQDIPVWDTTVANGAVSDITTVMTGTYETSRVFSTGAGQDEGLLMKVATNTIPLQLQYPLLETAINIGNSENPAVVLGYAQSSLNANKLPLLEIQMTVRADGPTPLGQFWAGDLAQVITSGWLSLGDGATDMRLLSISGTDNSEIKLSLQKESKFDIR